MKAKTIQQLTLMFLKTAPPASKQITLKMIQSAQLQKSQEKYLEPILNYIQCLQTHKEYLDFFQIGVVRDQKKKIQQVAKYVGLALDNTNRFQTNNDNRQSQLLDIIAKKKESKDTKKKQNK